MAEQYKIETDQELNEKITQEIEILESIFGEEGIILQNTTVTDWSDADASTDKSNTNSEQDDINSPISQFQVQCELDIKPNTGFD